MFTSPKPKRFGLFLYQYFLFLDVLGLITVRFIQSNRDYLIVKPIHKYDIENIPFKNMLQ